MSQLSGCNYGPGLSFKTSFEHQSGLDRSWGRKGKGNEWKITNIFSFSGRDATN